MFYFHCFPSTFNIFNPRATNHSVNFHSATDKYIHSQISWITISFTKPSPQCRHVGEIVEMCILYVNNLIACEHFLLIIVIICTAQLYVWTLTWKQLPKNLQITVIIFKNCNCWNMEKLKCSRKSRITKIYVALVVYCVATVLMLITLGLVCFKIQTTKGSEI